MHQKIIYFCSDNRILLDKDLVELFNNSKNQDVSISFLKKIKESFEKNIYTLSMFEQNIDIISEIYFSFSLEKRDLLEFLKSKLKITKNFKKGAANLEKNSNSGKNILKNIHTIKNIRKNEVEVEKFEENNGKFSKDAKKKVDDELKLKNKKKSNIEVCHFIDYFKKKFENMRDLILKDNNLKNLCSISKVLGNGTEICIVGMVRDKKITRNGNILLEVEDITGLLKIIVNKNRFNLFNIGENVCLDSVLGFRGGAKNGLMFCDDIIFPKSELNEIKKIEKDENILFIGDLHLGSKLFLKKSFEKFIKYLRSEDKDVLKIKYLFILGDVVSGIGNYPGQEGDLEIKDLKKQFDCLAEYLKQIPNRIKMVICPGNHDTTRLMEPQPIFSRKYAQALCELENIELVENPFNYNIDGINVLGYHGFSFFYYINNIDSLIKKKSIENPVEVMKYLLKNRSLSPSYGASQYNPKVDPYFIKEIPDIFVCGHIHKSQFENYNNTTLISTSCWEDLTSYQEKMGINPDFCRATLVNLKSREIKELDFLDRESERVERIEQNKEAGKNKNVN